MRTRLSTARPLDAGAAMAFLRAHAVPGVEEVDAAGGHCRRLLPTRAGLVDVRLRVDAGGADVVVDPPDRPVAGSADPLAEVAQTVRAWLDLDADLAGVKAALGQDPTIGPLLAARPGLRVVGHPVAFEALVMTVLGQQVSLAAARTFGARLVRRHAGPPIDGLVAFPDAAALAADDEAGLRRDVGITGARVRTVLTVARACADGLDLRAPDRAATRAALLALPGVGPWTVDYLSLRLGDRDAFCPGDLVGRRALGVGTPAEASVIASRWSPFRAYAMVHLWTAHALLTRVQTEPPA